MKILIGIIIILAVVISFIFNIIRTPDNLRGYYGIGYLIISVIAICAALCLMIL